MGHKVLLADDSITVQKIVKLSLTEEGIEVIAVGNGEQAVQQLETLEPDLIMADVFMPGKDGYEVCEFVKSQPHLKHIPVILLVHAFEPFDPERAQKAGADHQLTKPFQSIRTLVTTVQEMLESTNKTQAAAPNTEDVKALAVTAAGEGTVPPLVVNDQAGPEVEAISSLPVTMASPIALTSPLDVPLDVAFDTTIASESNVLTLPSPPLSMEVGVPLPIIGQEAAPLSNLLTPPESSIDKQQLGHQQATLSDSADHISAKSLPLSLEPLSLTDQVAIENSADDVLELSDVYSDRGGASSTAASLLSDQFTSEMPLLAVLGNTLSNTEESQSIIAPIESSQSGFAGSFDVATGNIPHLAETISMATPPAAQDDNIGIVLPPSGDNSIHIPDTVIEEIVNRVIQRLSTKAIQEIAWEVVPEMAELLIRKQLSQHNQLTH